MCVLCEQYRAHEWCRCGSRGWGCHMVLSCLSRYGAWDWNLIGRFSLWCYRGRRGCPLSCLNLRFGQDGLGIRPLPWSQNNAFRGNFSRKRPRRVLSKKALPLKIVIKDCPKFCWSDGCLYRLSSKTAQSSAEVMAVFTDCHQRLPKVLLKWWLSSKIVIKDCLKFCWSDGCL